MTQSDKERPADEAGRTATSPDRELSDAELQNIAGGVKSDGSTGTGTGDSGGGKKIP